MRKNIPGIFAIFLSAALLLTSCKKDDQHVNSGVIVGWSYGFCLPCGGFLLNLSNDTAINAHTYYVLNYSQSLDSVISNLSVEYGRNPAPIYVIVYWQPAPDSIYGRPSLFVTNIRTR